VIVSSAQEVKIYSATVEGQKSKEINRQKKMTSDRRGVPQGRENHTAYIENSGKYEPTTLGDK